MLGRVSSELGSGEVTGVGKYLDLSQHGVAEEYAEYLNIGSAEGIAKAKQEGIDHTIGIQESGELMEGIFYVYGIDARNKDLYTEIARGWYELAYMYGIAKKDTIKAEPYAKRAFELRPDKEANLLYQTLRRVNARLNGQFVPFGQ